MTQLQGFVGTPTTPMKANGDIDWELVPQVVDFLIDQGADVVAAPMHIGESLNLSIDERKELGRVVVAAARGRVPVIANASMPGTREAIDIAVDGIAAGADAVIATAPYFWQPSQRDLVGHFRAIAAEIGPTPLLAYNFPARLNVGLTLDSLEELVDTVPNFAGVKEASGNMAFFPRAVVRAHRIRPDFAMFVGTEYLITSVPAGAVGTFSPCGPVVPRLVKELLVACRENRFDEALIMQDRLLEIFEVLQPGYPATIKYAQELLGRPVGETRLPLGPLDADQKSFVKRRLTELAVFETEPSGWTS